MSEFGLKADASLAFIRLVSAINLEQNYAPEVLRLVAGLEEAGETPPRIVEELDEKRLHGQRSSAASFATGRR